jgi:hypothetical protein
MFFLFFLDAIRTKSRFATLAAMALKLASAEAENFRSTTFIEVAM